MRIGLSYGHVASNIGDLCINQGVISLINEIYPNTEIEVVLRNPNQVYLNESKRTFNENSNVTFHIFETPKGIEESVALLEYYLNHPEVFLIDMGLKDCDVILNNSGEFIFSYNDDPRLDLLWRILPAYAANKTGKKFITLPSTLGPFEDHIGSTLIKEFFASNFGYAVRDANSLDHITELTNEDPTALLLDPAFFITHRPIPKEKTNYERLALIMRLDNFGLRVGGSNSSKNYREMKENHFKDNLSYKFSYEISKKFSKESSNPIIDIYIQTRYDRDLALQLKEDLDEEGLENIINIIEPNSIEDYLTHLSKADFVISSRFHGCILSLLAGVTPMAVYFKSHGHKMPGLYKMLHLDNICFELTNESIESIPSNFWNIYNDKQSSYKVAKKNIEQYRQLTVDWLENLLSKEDFYSKDKLTMPTINKYFRTLIDHDLFNQIDKAHKNTKELQKLVKLQDKTFNKRLTELESINSDQHNSLINLENKYLELFKALKELEENNELLEKKVIKQNREINFQYEKLTHLNEHYSNSNNIKKALSKNLNYFFKKQTKNTSSIFLEIPFKATKSELNLILKCNREKECNASNDNIYIDLPKNEHLYFTSKNDFDFNKPETKQPIDIQNNQIYQLRGALYFENIKVSLWIIEYNSKERLSENKYRLKSGKFHFDFQSHNEANHISLSLRVEGKGSIERTSTKWEIIGLS
ncbi:polysaccharide pyruvyl transferase family protein [Saliterribacillus persicus]|uniref:Polysaccharide pyruvyl transferase WcaK-like protein n=1 Tax=Saliterribacillus persicus TaxID=930114 RepID=A0A368YB92_9BACI|nr:polysaccharide pyruvyl transferase family protein [Saliterribacillus persicus]RCW77395.1 polysaccharide pyruvyl transferase WcaK-like protein [Saliterribacillus persicus]